METAKLGQIKVYTGEGKGKSSAALGLAIRAVGQDKKVMIIYCDQNESSYTERYVLNKLSGDVDYEVSRLDMIDPATDRWKSDFGPKDFESSEKIFDTAKKISSSGKYDLLILDEINPVLSFGLIPLNDFLTFLDGKPAHLDVVLTGQNCPDEIKNRADSYVILRDEKADQS